MGRGRRLPGPRPCALAFACASALPARGVQLSGDPGFSRAARALRALLSEVEEPLLRNDALGVLDGLVGAKHVSLRRERGGSSEPHAFFGSLKPCSSDFVRNSFTEEELVRAESNLGEWLATLDERIEAFNDADGFAGRPLDRKNNDRIPHRRFEVVLPEAGPLCKDNLTVFGGDGNTFSEDITVRDFQKPICNAGGRLFQEGDCDLISIGSNNEFSTEAAMYNATSCRIHTFDCTMRTDTSPLALRDRLTWHRTCIGTEDKLDEKKRQFLSWGSLLQSVGIVHSPEYLKMDIEGMEFPLLRSMLHNGSLLPNQIAMEIHHNTWGSKSGRAVGNLSWADRNKDTGELLAFILMLYKSGYRLTNIDHETLCSHCMEVLLSRVWC